MTDEDRKEFISEIKRNPHNKIEHIKFVRSKLKLDLKDAKDLVDQLYVEISQEDPSFKRVMQSKGCFGLLAIGGFTLFLGSKLFQILFV